MATEKKKYVYEVEYDTEGAVKSMGKLDDSIDEANNSQKELNQSVESGTGALDKMTGGAISGFQSMVKGVKAATVGMKTLRGAIISTGIGALVVAVGSLVAYFNQTERGAQKLRVIMAGLGAAAGSLSDVFVNLGELIFAAVTLDADAVNKSYEQLKSAVAGLGAEIAKDVKDATELEKRLNDVIVKERELRVERAQAQQEIAKARAVSQDMEKSAQERLAAVEKASKLEQELTEREVALAEEKLKIMQEQANLNESDEATLEAIANQEVEVANLQTASYNTQLRLAADLKRLRNEIAQEAKENAKNESSILQEERLKTLELIVDKELEIEIKSSKMKLDINKKYARDYQKLKEDEAARELKIKEQVEAGKEKIQQQSFQTAQILTRALEQSGAIAAEDAFNISKGLGIVEATINTAKAVTAALATPVIGPALAASTGALGAAQIALIASQQFNAGTAASSGGSTATAPTVSYAAPQFNIAGDTGTNQLTQALNNQRQQPVKAYVTTQDYRSAEALERNVQNSSRL